MKFVRSGRVYILPTRFGLVYFVSVLVMLLIGAAYANNLVNLLAFFLASIGVVAMVQTNDNLKKLVLENIQIEGGFSGSTLIFSARLRNPTQSHRYNVSVEPKALSLNRESETDRPLAPNSASSVTAWYQAQKRGVHRLEWVKVSTVYPLGLFNAWMWIKTDVSYFIYPKPEGLLPLPQNQASPLKDNGKHDLKGGEDFSGHRNYITGDSPRHIDWRAFARNRPLLVKQFNTGAPPTLNFDFQSLSHLDTEKKLSQLCAWIEIAQRKQFTYGLKLPHITIAPSTGRKHYVQCLEELAKYGGSDAAS